MAIEQQTGVDQQEFTQDPADVEFIQNLARKLLEFVETRESDLETEIHQAEAKSGKTRTELAENDIRPDGTKGHFSQKTHFLELFQRVKTEFEYASGENVDLYTIDFADFFRVIRFTDVARDDIANANLEKIQNKYQRGKS